MMFNLTKKATRTVLPYVIAFAGGAIFGSGVLSPDKDYQKNPQDDYAIEQKVESETDNHNEKSSLIELLK